MWDIHNAKSQAVNSWEKNYAELLYFKLFIHTNDLGLLQVEQVIGEHNVICSLQIWFISVVLVHTQPPCLGPLLVCPAKVRQ